MKKKLVAIFICLIPIYLIHAQAQTTYYIKGYNEIVKTLDSADYIRKIEHSKNNEGLYNVSEFYKDNSKKTIGSSIRDEFIPQYSGNVLSFYKNGVIESKETYNKGEKSGISDYYYQNGNLKKQMKFSLNLKGEQMELMIQIADSLGNKFLDESGTGKFKISDVNEKIEGEYLKGYENGFFKTHDFNLNEDYIDEYRNGEYIKGKTIDSTGNVKEYEALFILPTFKGGVKAFGNFLARKLKYPDISRKNKTQGRVYLSFVVEKDGSLSDIKVLKGVTTEINNEALRVLNMSPNWNPGIRRGEPVKVSYTIPIVFQLR